MSLKKLAKCAGAGAVILLMLFALAGCSGVDQDVYNKVVSEKAALKTLSDSQASQIESLYTKEQLDAAKDLYTQDELNTAIADAKAAELVVEAEAEVEAAVVEASGYELDELSIGIVPAKCLSDKHVDKLVDGEVDFDGEEYDVEEFVCVAEGLELSVNGNDFGSDVFLTADEGAVKYVVQFDSELNVSLIGEDETLEFSLLGKEVEVNSWVCDDKGENCVVTLIQGTGFSLDEGDTVALEVDEVAYEVQVVYVDGDGAKLVVNGELTGKLDVGEVYELADESEVQLTDVLYQPYAGGVHRVEFKLGADLKVVIEDSEEYEEDSMWSWYVGENELGLVLTEELAYLDEDEDFQAVAAGESVCLPEDYICVTFPGMDEVDMVEYKFDVYTKQNEEYLRVRGDLTFDMEDFSKVYVSAAEGILDSDLEVIGNCLEMDGTEFSLCLVEGRVVLESEEEDIILELDLSDISTTGAGSVESEEEDYRTAYGVVLSSPEDAVDDQELRVEIPEEQLMGRLVIG